MGDNANTSQDLEVVSNEGEKADDAGQTVVELNNGTKLSAGGDKSNKQLQRYPVRLCAARNLKQENIRKLAVCKLTQVTKKSLK